MRIDRVGADPSASIIYCNLILDPRSSPPLGGRSARREEAEERRRRPEPCRAAVRVGRRGGVPGLGLEAGEEHPVAPVEALALDRAARVRDRAPEVAAGLL